MRETVLPASDVRQQDGIDDLFRPVSSIAWYRGGQVADQLVPAPVTHTDPREPVAFPTPGGLAAGPRSNIAVIDARP